MVSKSHFIHIREFFPWRSIWFYVLQVLQWLKSLSTTPIYSTRYDDTLLHLNVRREFMSNKEGRRLDNSLLTTVDCGMVECIRNKESSGSFIYLFFEIHWLRHILRLEEHRVIRRVLFELRQANPGLGLRRCPRPRL